MEPPGAEALWNGLHGVLRRGGLAGIISGRPHVAFEVGFSAGRLRFGLWVPAGVSAGRVARVVEAAWPGAVTEVLDTEAPLPGGAGITGGELRLAGPEWFSLRVDQPADPYRLLLAALGGLDAGAAAVVQVLARPATRSRYGRCRKAAIALRTGRPRSCAAGDCRSSSPRATTNTCTASARRIGIPPAAKSPGTRLCRVLQSPSCSRCHRNFDLSI